MRKDHQDRRAVYGLRRLSLAVDRVITGRDPEAARRWARLWARVAKVEAKR